jgi:hypothetical protein
MLVYQFLHGVEAEKKASGSKYQERCPKHLCLTLQFHGPRSRISKYTGQFYTKNDVVIASIYLRFSTVILMDPRVLSLSGFCLICHCHLEESNQQCTDW